MAGSREEAGEARALVLALGWNASAYQILNPGIAHWFSAGRDAVVGYVHCPGFRVVAGAPVCREDRLAAVVDEFERDTHGAGLRACYFAAERRLAGLLGATGRHALMRLGAQPTWDPAGWHDGVRGHASLRAQLNRAHNKGVVAREWITSREPATDGMRRCLAEWLATRGTPPLHFLIEPETLGMLGDRRLFVAERGGETVGFLVASPVPRRDGWLVEQIIRGRGAVNGTSELLVDAAMRALAASGSRYVTLGLSPLSRRTSVGEVATPLWLRALLGWVRAHGRRFYNFEGLDAFKAKLGPHDWEPLYAISDRPAISPAVLLAIMGAFSGGSPVVTVARALAWAARQEARTLKRRAVGRRPYSVK